MNGLSLRGRALYVDDADTLVVADLHVGRDESSNVELPLGEQSDLRERLRGHLDHFQPESVVFAGDTLHAHGAASAASVRRLRELAATCRERGADPVFVAGNHDGTLNDLRSEDVHEKYAVEQGDDASTAGGTVVCHGHESPARDADRYVVGHDHPTIEIEGVRQPCVLFGPGAYRGADVVMLPAFSRLAPGVVVNGMRSKEFQSPLVTDADVFRPIVYDGDASEALAFPPLGEFRELLRGESVPSCPVPSRLGREGSA
ncbi:metallophosphoesterase [Haloparvum sp. PAK95]|uniref:metallophosphoesterase n=1 Tax=Haloparvum sp. PAK95 TaxID=3418962 RepID=UPI003D2EC282